MRKTACSALVMSLAAALLVGGPVRAVTVNTGLVQIVSPVGKVFAPEGATRVTVHLEVAFGKADDGMDADPSTFVPTLTGMQSDALKALFSDVKDANGKVTGKKADVTLTLVPGKLRRFSFKAKVFSLVSPGGIVARGSSKVSFTPGPDHAPAVQNLRITPSIIAYDGSSKIVAGQTVTIQADLSDADNDPIVSYQVSFGDGQSVTRNSAAGFTQVSEAHVYSNAQSLYTVTVTAGDGLLTSDPQLLKVRINAPPVPKLRINPTRGTFKYPVYVDAADSYDPDGDPMTFVWDFGDGNAPVTGAGVSHIYQQPVGTSSATYTVTLTATDNSGASAVTRGTILVKTGLTGETMLNAVSPLPKEHVVGGSTLPVQIAVGRASSGALPDASTFKAVLNGVNVTSYFTDITDAQRGGMVVGKRGAIPTPPVRLGGGRNTLKGPRANNL